MGYLECCKVSIRGKIIGEITTEDFPAEDVEMMWIDGKIVTSNSYESSMGEGIQEGQSLILKWTRFCDWHEACQGFLFDEGDHVEINGTLQQLKKDYIDGNSNVYISIDTIDKLNADGSKMDFETMRSEYLAKHPIPEVQVSTREMSPEELTILQKHEEDICLF